MKKLMILILFAAALTTGCADKDNTKENQNPNIEADIPDKQETTPTKTANFEEESFDIEEFSFENVDTDKLDYHVLALNETYGYDQEESSMEGAAVSVVYRDREDDKKVVILYSGPQEDINTSDRTDNIDSVIHDTAVSLQQVSDSAQYSAWWNMDDNKYLIDTFNLTYEDFMNILEDCLSQTNAKK